MSLLGDVVVNSFKKFMVVIGWVQLNEVADRQLGEKFVNAKGPAAITQPKDRYGVVCQYKVDIEFF